jgi:hypothetical protein
VVKNSKRQREVERRILRYKLKGTTKSDGK